LSLFAKLYKIRRVEVQPVSMPWSVEAARAQRTCTSRLGIIYRGAKCAQVCISSAALGSCQDAACATMVALRTNCHEKASALGNRARYSNDAQQSRVRGTGRRVSMLRRRMSRRIQAGARIITGRARTSWRRTPDWRTPRPRRLPEGAFCPALPSFIAGSS